MSGPRPREWLRQEVFGAGGSGAFDFWTTSSFAGISIIDVGTTLLRTTVTGGVNVAFQQISGGVAPSVNMFTDLLMVVGVWADTISDVLTNPGDVIMDPDNPSWVWRDVLQKSNVSTWTTDIGTTYSMAMNATTGPLASSRGKRGPASGAAAALYLVWGFESTAGFWWDNGVDWMGWMGGGFEASCLVELPPA